MNPRSALGGVAAAPRKRGESDTVAFHILVIYAIAWIVKKKTIDKRNF
jgi:hypothetical protein